MSVEAFPADVFSNGEFDLQEYMAINRSRGTLIDVFEIAPRRWRCPYITPMLPRNDAQLWKAWRDRQRGGQNQFYGYDPERRYPRDYATGFAGQTRHLGGAFDGTGDIDAITAFTATLSNLPSTFQFRAGDLIGLIDGTDRAVHEVQADAAAVAGVVTVTVEPEIITTIYDAASTFNLDRPVCIMIMEPNTWSAPRGLEGGIIRFTGIQKLV